MEKILTANDIAKRLNVTICRADFLCRTGRIKATKIGRDWLISEEDFEAFTPLKSGRPRTQKKGSTK